MKTWAPGWPDQNYIARRFKAHYGAQRYRLPGPLRDRRHPSGARAGRLDYAGPPKPAERSGEAD